MNIINDIKMYFVMENGNGSKGKQKQIRQSALVEVKRNDT